jgi:hypothetical protein
MTAVGVDPPPMTDSMTQRPKLAMVSALIGAADAAALPNDGCDADPEELPQPVISAVASTEPTRTRPFPPTITGTSCTTARGERVIDTRAAELETHIRGASSSARPFGRRFQVGRHSSRFIRAG